MKIVIKKSSKGSWTNMCKIEIESDWQALSIWLSPDKIDLLRKTSALTDGNDYYYVSSDAETIEFEKNIAPLLK